MFRLKMRMEMLARPAGNENLSRVCFPHSIQNVGQTDAPSCNNFSDNGEKLEFDYRWSNNCPQLAAKNTPAPGRRGIARTCHIFFGSSTGIRCKIAKKIVHRKNRYCNQKQTEDIAASSVTNSFKGEHLLADPVFHCIKQNWIRERNQPHRPSGTMIFAIFSRFMSTARTSVFGESSSSQQSIEKDQSKLLENSQGNKRVSINACGKLYSELSASNPALFGSAPKGVGINFEVDYFDSLDLIGQRKGIGSPPTVCLLHGAPGHYKDYASLINYLTAREVRVIAPNFPDYSATFQHSFRHSARERADFLAAFFRAIHLDRVDLIAGHSSAVYPMFELLEQYHERRSDEVACAQICSLGLFSTPAYDLPQNMVATPLRMFFLKLFDFAIFRPIISAFIETFAKLQGIQNRVDKNNMTNLLIAASAVGYSDYEKMEERLRLIGRHGIPTILVYGTSDRLIPANYFRKLSHDLGVHSEDGIKLYNGDGSLKRDALSPSQLIQVSEFESGGHYTFQRYAEQVNEDVYRFLLDKVIRHSVESTKL